MFDGAEVTVRLSDESAKIDVNTANNELLKGLFRYAGVSEEDAAKLLDAVLDWRDPDSLKRPLGAEEPEYAQAGLKGRPANYPFQSTEELQLVLGMRPEVYQRIAPMITVYSRQSGVNPHLAAASRAARHSRRDGGGGRPLSSPSAKRRGAEGRTAPIFTAAGAYASYVQTAGGHGRAPTCRWTTASPLSRGRRSRCSRPQFPRRPYTFLAWREVSRDAGCEGARRRRRRLPVGQPR